jgi:GT2 family glycosyltransferase
MLSVTIVIPAYNEQENIAKCLQSLLSLPQNAVKEILVIDKNSTDKTREIAESIKSENLIKVISEQKKGVVWARTRGFEEATGEIVAFLDADTFVDEQWFLKLTRYFEDLNLVCVSGPSVYYDFPKWKQAMANAYWSFASIIIFPIVGYMGNFANMAVRKSALQSVGGIDTTVLFYGDDTDVPRRLSKVGKVMFSQNFFVYASARRFKKEGVFKTTFLYAINFLSEVVLRRPITKNHTDVR